MNMVTCVSTKWTKITSSVNSLNGYVLAFFVLVLKCIKMLKARHLINLMERGYKIQQDAMSQVDHQWKIILNNFFVGN